MNHDSHRVLLELTIFDLKNDSSGVHVYLPKDITENEFTTAIASLTKVLNSFTERSLTSLQQDAQELYQ